MTTGELLLTALVALVVFGPKQLPMLARRLGRITRQTEQMKQRLTHYLENQHNQIQLGERLKKANIADKAYQSDYDLGNNP